MIGAPKILAFIYFLTLEERPTPDLGLFTLEAAIEAEELEGFPQRTWGTSYTATKPPERSGPGGRARSSPPLPPVTDDVEKARGSATNASTQKPTTTVRPKKNATHAPNIFMNLSPTRNQLELRICAVFAVALQAGVLVFAGYATYDITLNNRIGGKTSVYYGYPLAAMGTVVLVIGMLICSFVVEASTREVLWKIKSDETKGFRILWLQQGENVNDQVFDSYAIFAEGDRQSILTSRLSDHHAYTRDGNSLPRILLSTQTLVIIGTLISVGGFIIQLYVYFVSLVLCWRTYDIFPYSTGLRGMNWSASVAQLVATLIMAVVRAIVRRDVATPPHSQKTPHGHELDWLATRIASDSKKLWPGGNSGDSVDSKSVCISLC